jgi:hypothetical protein
MPTPHGATRLAAGPWTPPGSLSRCHRSGQGRYALSGANAVATAAPFSVVRKEGVEPSRPKTHAPEACVATSYTTRA